MAKYRPLATQKPFFESENYSFLHIFQKLRQVQTPQGFLMISRALLLWHMVYLKRINKKMAKYRPLAMPKTGF